MSILCRGFSDVDRYTQGFPDNVVGLCRLNQVDP
jgi:hypothetical protein